MSIHTSKEIVETALKKNQHEYNKTDSIFVLIYIVTTVISSVYKHTELLFFVVSDFKIYQRYLVDQFVVGTIDKFLY